MKFIPFQEEKIIDGRTYIFYRQAQDVLRHRRLELGYTQAQVAKEAGIHLRQYERLETGEAEFCASNARTLLSVCALLKLDPYMFFPEITGNGDMTDASHGNDTSAVKVYTIPEKPRKYIPLEEYMDLLRQVPAGKVVTAKTVDAYFKKKYYAEVIEIEYMGSAIEILNMSFPFWRELSASGHLYATTRFRSRDQQQRLLEQEGLEIVPCGANQASLKVKDYKKHLFDLSGLLG